MKVFGICGSHRKDSSTSFFIGRALSKCAEAGLETEFVELWDREIHFCDACDGCKSGGGCVKKDGATEILRKMEEADAIIIGSPTYFASVSGKVKALMDRTLSLRRKDFALDNKVGGAIASGAARNGGQELVCSQIHSWMFLHGMVVVADSKDTAHFGGIAVIPRGNNPSADRAGTETAENLGKKIAETLKIKRK